MKYFKNEDIYNISILVVVQLGQASVNLPDLFLKWGAFNFAGSHAWKAEFLPT